MSTKKALMISAILVFALMITAPALAGSPYDDGTCTTPPDEYFVKDSLASNGIPAHDTGLQLGFVFNTFDNNKNQYAGNHYLGITEYALGDSHWEQEKIAMGKMFYCLTIPDYPYVPEKYGSHTSENPATSIYLTPQELRAAAA